MWSTMLPPPKGTYHMSPLKDLPFLWAMKWISHLGWAFLVLTAPLSVRFWRKLPWKAWVMIGGLIFMNWFCYVVVFFPKARYRYLTETLMCILSGWAIAQWLEWKKARKIKLSEAKT